jgi:hypothetical protein
MLNNLPQSNLKIELKKLSNAIFGMLIHSSPIEIANMNIVALNIFFFSSTGYDECLILYGDSTGCVNILVIHSAGECLRYVCAR